MLSSIERLRSMHHRALDRLPGGPMLPVVQCEKAAYLAFPHLLDIAEAVANLKREGWFLPFSEDSNVIAINDALNQLEAM